MSLLAKIFVVFNAILSLLFLGVTSTLFYHANNWQEAYERLQVKARVMQAESADKFNTEHVRAEDLAKQLATAKEEANTARAQAKGAADMLGDKQNELSNEKQRTSDLSRKFDIVMDGQKQKDQTITQLDGRVKELEQQRQDALGKEELAEAQVARLSTIKTTLEKDLADVRKDYTKTKQDLLDSQLVMDELRRQGIPVETLVVNHKPVPPINGTVAGVDAKAQPAIVLINVGKDDKVERGYTFTVYRQSKFVGKILVEKLMADSAGCRVMFTATGEQIQPGDSVATRLD